VKIKAEAVQMKNGTLNLAAMKSGQRGKIAEMDLNHPSCQRMMAMGFLIGVPVEFLRVAPMGDPIAIRLGSQVLSLRRAEAAAITIVCQEVV